MSQYDSNGDPTTTFIFYPNCADSSSPVIPTDKPLQTCYAEGINKASATDTPGIPSSYSALPYHSHRRRSTLSGDGYQVKHLIRRISLESPVFDDSPETELTGSERKEITQIEASGRQDDDVRMMVHSDRRAREKAITHAWECAHADESCGKLHMGDSSWVRRSRVSCDMFVQGYKKEVGDCQGVNIVDLSSGRPDHG